MPPVTIDAIDYVAFAIFGILLVAGVILAVSLGQLPGQIARQRGHPQATAVSAARWLGVFTGGVLWPLALIWALWKPITISVKQEER